MKKIIIIIGLILINIFFIDTAYAGKILPRFSKTGKTVTVSTGFLVSVRLRSDRQALLVNFANLQKINSADYTLYYQTNGKDEGVSGSIDTSVGSSTSRELLFGTCSSGVCRYHTNITGMTFEVNYQLTSGKRYLKRFKIRV